MRVSQIPRGARYAPAIVVALAIGYASVIEPSGAQTGLTLFGVVSDYWLHATAYAVLSGTIAYANLPAYDSVPKRMLAIAYFASFGYGLTIELLQAPLSYRMFSLVDVAANAGGAFFGIAVSAVVGNRYFV